MKFTSEVIAALATLREHAENDFELHFLDVLEQDLTAPPTVEIVDDEHQKFNGVVYTKNKFGHFYKNHDSIHRAVWTYYHGDIPVGNYEVHHIDHNKANNHIENLRLLTANEHHQLHNPRQPDIEKICPVCKKIFIVRPARKKQICCSTTCSNAYKAKLIEKICPVCGKTFIVKRCNPNQTYCSRTCSYTHRTKPIAEKICPICGKKFIPSTPHSQAITCSMSCKAKLIHQKRLANGSYKKHRKS
jgi:hypothetical protein